MSLLRLPSQPSALFFSCLLLATGCSLADPALYEALPSANDGGAEDGGTTDDGGNDPDTPMTEQDAVNRCGDPASLVIDETTMGLRINTETFTNEANPGSRCGGIATGGPDGFIGIDVVAGQIWHFHLRVVGRTDRNPSLYLLEDTCNVLACEESADNCPSSEEEHFAFVPTSSGRWYIGIDDGEMGGAEYNLDAYLTTCDAMRTEHGEACDGRDGERSENCSDDCRILLNSTNTREQSPNQNFVEASEVVLSDDGTLVVSGDIGSDTSQCTYPDMFTMRLSAGQTFDVRPEPTCNAAANARYALTLLSASGNVLQADQMMSGCPFLNYEVPDGGDGRYFIRLDHRPFGDETVETYNLRFAVTTP